MRPENTIAAFRYAAEIGCDGVELDVHRSADGVPVVIHDEMVTLPDGRNLPVGVVTAAELATIDVGEGETIPTLEAVLALLQPTSLYVQIELKGAGVEAAAAALVDRYGLVRRAVFTSFVHERVLAAKQILPAIRTGVLLSSVPLRLIEVAHWAYADNIHLDHRRITAKIVTDVHHAGKTMVAWGKISRPAQVDRLIAMGVDVIGSDWPHMVLERRAADRHERI